MPKTLLFLQAISMWLYTAHGHKIFYAAFWLFLLLIFYIVVTRKKWLFVDWFLFNSTLISMLVGVLFIITNLTCATGLGMSIGGLNMVSALHMMYYNR